MWTLRVLVGTVCSTSVYHGTRVLFSACTSPDSGGRRPWTAPSGAARRAGCRETGPRPGRGPPDSRGGTGFTRAWFDSPVTTKEHRRLQGSPCHPRLSLQACTGVIRTSQLPPGPSPHPSPPARNSPWSAGDTVPTTTRPALSAGQTPRVDTPLACAQLPSSSRSHISPTGRPPQLGAPPETQRTPMPSPPPGARRRGTARLWKPPCPGHRCPGQSSRDGVTFGTSFASPASQAPSSIPGTQ